MPQTLVKSDGLKLHVDHTFTGGEVPAKQIAVPGPHGYVMSLTQAIPAAPNVHLCVCNIKKPVFFYDNGQPLNVLEHTTHLPARMKVHVKDQFGRVLTKLINPRAMAVAFAEVQAPPADDVVEQLEDEVQAVAPHPQRRAAKPRGGRRVVSPAREPRGTAKPQTGGAIVLSGGTVLGTRAASHTFKTQAETRRAAKADGANVKGLAEPPDLEE